MTEHCPTCGQKWPEPAAIADWSSLEAILRTSTQERERSVYLGRDNYYYITYGGGRVLSSVVKKAAVDGRLVDRHPNASDVDWWCLPGTEDHGVHPSVLQRRKEERAALRARALVGGS